MSDTKKNDPGKENKMENHVKLRLNLLNFAWLFLQLWMS